MAQNGSRSSPSRRSWQLSTPDRASLSDFVSRTPHSELNHKEALEAAKQHHDRIQEAARRTLELYQLGEKQKDLLEKRKQEAEKYRLQDEILKEQERLRHEEMRRIQALQDAETARLAEEKRKAQEAAKLQELRARKATPPPPPALSQPAPTAKTQQTTSQTTAPAQRTSLAPAPAVTTKAPSATTPSMLGNGAKALSSNLSQPAASVAPQAVPTASPSLAARQAAIRKVHQNLKKLRSSMSQLIQENKRTKANPQLGQINDMRRDIGKWVGQLGNAAGGNKKQLNWIMETLTKAMSIPCPLINPNDYLLEKREAVGNDDQPQLPSAYIYLLNMFAKKIIKQFAEECGADTKAADPIGVLAVQIFSRPQFLWRGKSLVDILMAKFYTICPVVLGVRGNEGTPQGLKAVGWRYQDNKPMPDAQHYMRMTGFGAGFAALTLRDFSKSPMEPPLPPWHYWKAFAAIVNTPSSEICSTQLVVLKSMIEGHEQRFLTFYGNIAVAALRAALVDLPRRCPEKNSPVGALEVLGELLAKNTGLPIM